MEICVVVWHKRRRGLNLVVVRVLSSHVLSLTVCCLKIPSILVAGGGSCSLILGLHNSCWWGWTSHPGHFTHWIATSVDWSVGMNVAVRKKPAIEHRTLPFKSTDHVVCPGSYSIATHRHFHWSVLSQGSDRRQTTEPYLHGYQLWRHRFTPPTVISIVLPPPIDRSRDVKFPEVLHHLVQLREQYAIERYTNL